MANFLQKKLTEILTRLGFTENALNTIKEHKDGDFYIGCVPELSFEDFKVKALENPYLLRRVALDPAELYLSFNDSIDILNGKLFVNIKVHPHPHIKGTVVLKARVTKVEAYLDDGSVKRFFGMSMYKSYVALRQRQQ